MKFLKVFFCIFVLSSLFLSPYVSVKGDTAFLQLSSNVYYEQDAVVSSDIESKENTTHLFDYSLNDNHLFINGSMAVQTGFFGDCYYFDGSTKESVQGYDLNVETQDFTIMAWVKRDGSMQYNQVIGYRVSAGVGFYIGGINATNLRARRGSYDLISNTSMPDNTWTHITFSYVNSGTTAYLFQNWSCVSSGSFISYFTEDYSIGGKRQTSDDSIWVDDYWKGNIDEVRIFENLAITDENTIEEWAMRQIQTPLTIQELEANTDVVQLWYNASTLFEQQIADSNGEVTFNVYNFSSQTSPYEGIINIYHEDIQYSGYVMVLNWGDILEFTVLGVFADLFTQLFFGTGAWLGLIIVISIALLLTHFVKYGSLVFYPILFFFGLGYLQNVSADSNLLYATVISWVTIPLLLFIEMKQN